MAISLPVLDAVEPLPDLYQRWLTALLPGPIPRETNATCGDCAMCQTGDGDATPSDTQFDRDTKCCTYLPDIHNFLVGAALVDDDPAAATGRASLETRIRQSVAVTPLGLSMPASYKVLYDSDRQLFGRAPSLRCPHYVNANGGMCGIWKFRNSVCSTWFCKHVRGDVGASFWHDVRALLSTIEQELSVWCLLELGLDTPLMRRIIASINAPATARVGAELIASRREEYQREMWGAWYGREAELYRACAQHVSALSWEDVCTIGGPVARARRTVLLRAYDALTSRELPPRLEAAPLSRRPATAANVQVSTYSPHDPLLVAHELLGVLHHFDGRPTSRVLAEVEASEGIVLEEPLVQRLVDFRVLREPAAQRLQVTT
jgi:hypothetical protein